MHSTGFSVPLQEYPKSSSLARRKVIKDLVHADVVDCYFTVGRRKPLDDFDVVLNSGTNAQRHSTKLGFNCVGNSLVTSFEGGGR
jgi:hypothetical protein